MRGERVARSIDASDSRDLTRSCGVTRTEEKKGLPAIAEDTANRRGRCALAPVRTHPGFAIAVEHPRTARLNRQRRTVDRREAAQRSAIRQRRQLRRLDGR